MSATFSKGRTLLIAMVVASIFLVLVQAFGFYLTAWLWILAALPELLSIAVFAAITMAALAALLLGRGPLIRRTIPVLIAAAAAGMAFAVPWDRLAVEFDFWLKRSAREQVAADIYAGKYARIDHRLVEVPGGVSDRDRVQLIDCGERPCIYFVIFAGALDATSGFLFAPDGPLVRDSEMHGIRRLDDNWLYVFTN